MPFMYPILVYLSYISCSHVGGSSSAQTTNDKSTFKEVVKDGVKGYKRISNELQKGEWYIKKAETLERAEKPKNADNKDTGPWGLT